MNPVAIVVIGFVVLAVIGLFIMLALAKGREVGISRSSGNLIRFKMADKAGALVYLHENADGSTCWRYVSAV